MTDSARLHPDQPATDPALVRRLIASQHPQWADLAVRPAASDGTTNALFRLGDSLSVRLPLVGYGESAIDKEQRWLAHLAPHLPLAIPEQVAIGEPGEGYPFRWSVHTWIAGDVVTTESVPDLKRAAIDLAEWITALQRVDAQGGPDAAALGLRGAPLEIRDDAVRRGIDALQEEIDVDRAWAIWNRARRADVWDRPPVWCHGDLMPGNMLARDGRLTGVIDFGSLGVGDPACDLMIGWALFEGESRAAFREALRADDALWARGHGHALYHGLIYIPYYRDSNPRGTAAVFRMLRSVLADHG